MGGEVVVRLPLLAGLEVKCLGENVDGACEGAAAPRPDRKISTRR